MIVVNNYFSGVLKRGIPIYTEELVLQMKKDSVKVLQLTCPRFLYPLPAFLHNILFIIYEQVLTPLSGLVLKSKFNIYPYNSVSILDAYLGKSVVIVHDLISLRKRNRSLSAKYVSFCLLKAAKLKSDYIYISKTTKRIIDNIHLFKHCKGYYFPNTFFRFEEIAKKHHKQDRRYILLVTGVGDNKDLNGAMHLYSSLDKEKRLPLKILGCGNAIERVKKIIGSCSLQNEVEVIPFLDLEEVVNLYCSSSFIWAHSKYEGYGRAVAEAKLSHKKILCTKISAFLEQKDDNVYLYANQDDFPLQYQSILLSEYNDTQDELAEHKIFKAQLEFLYGKK